MASSFKMEDWAADKKHVWHKICDKYGGNKEAFDWGTWFFFDWSVGKAWPTLSSMNKARKFGFYRQDDTYETWVETFKAFENAGILPRQRVLLKQSKSEITNGMVANGTKATNFDNPKAEVPSLAAA